MIFPPLVFVILYVVFCWLLGYLGRNAKFGFWGNFWVSVILTPVIGIVVLLAQDSRPDRNKANSQARQP
ncbi:MAG: hypothetical protein PHE83_12110 [Opitutaceae bacterium]|nr:hypothetical protein [Opitutaceae bacterium]